jgi:3-deoxy-D-manno-octulosonic-acid transferase
MGPGMANFREIARDLLARGAALQVPGPAELGDLATALLGDPARRAALSAAAIQWRGENRGGVERTLESLRGELAGSP